jgi:large subunit ribosomal protein L23
MANISLIKKPWVTEKSGMMNAGAKYTFLVEDGAAKPEIKKAIKAIYKVDVVSVNVINKPTKQRHIGRGRKSNKDAYRKAIVTLKDGQKIDIQ